jgi:hypothetical protein
MIVDLTSNEKAVHGDFYNGLIKSHVYKVFSNKKIFLFIGFVDLCDDDDLL